MLGYVLNHTYEVPESSLPIPLDVRGLADELNALGGLQVDKVMYRYFENYVTVPHRVHFAMIGSSSILTSALKQVNESIRSNKVNAYAKVSVYGGNGHLLELQSNTLENLSTLAEFTRRVIKGKRTYVVVKDKSRTKELRKLGKGVDRQYIAVGDHVSYRNPLLRLLHKLNIIGV